MNKCLIGAFAGKRTLVLGDYTAAWNDVRIAYDTFGAGEVGMTQAAISREDRQNFLASVMVSGLKASAKLKELRTNPREVRTPSTREGPTRFLGSRASSASFTSQGS